MKHFYHFLLVNVLIYSCNPADKAVSEQINDTPALIKDSIPIKSERQTLIKELHRLQKVFASNDKEVISEIFTFPIPGESISMYIDNDDFYSREKKNGNKISKEMFMDYYPEISESLQIDQINALFEQIDIDSLQNKNTLEYSAIIKTEPCYNYYRIIVENELVTLLLGMNSNNDYDNKVLTEENLPENDSSVCEHMLWWVFSFDGVKLKFKEISGAG